MTSFVVYSKKFCKECNLAKELLLRKGADFQVFMLTDKQYKKVKERTGQYDYPFVYVDDKFLGGYDELVDYLSIETRHIKERLRVKEIKLRQLKNYGARNKFQHNIDKELQRILLFDVNEYMRIRMELSEILLNSGHPKRNTMLNQILSRIDKGQKFLMKDVSKIMRDANLNLKKQTLRIVKEMLSKNLVPYVSLNI